MEDTSSGRRELSPADEPKVSCPGPQCLGSIPKAQACVEMIRLEGLAVVDGIVAAGCVRAIHPDLQKEA